MKSRLMVVQLLRRLTLLSSTSNKKLRLIRYSTLMTFVIFLVSQKVKDSRVLLKDGVLKSFQERLTEVEGRLVVLDLGIQQESNGPVQELVNWVTTTELK